jgi:hypothetical protein
VPTWPPGRVEVVTASGVTTVIDSPESVAVCGGRLESATCAVKLEVPPAVGVPEITPDVLSESPAGNDPDTNDHVYGAYHPTPSATH